MKKTLFFVIISFVVVSMWHFYSNQSLAKNVFIYRGSSTEVDWEITLDYKRLKFRVIIIQNDIHVDDISGRFTVIDGNTYSLIPSNTGQIIMPYSSEEAPGYPLKVEKTSEGIVSRLVLQSADFECKNFDIYINEIKAVK